MKIEKILEKSDKKRLTNDKRKGIMIEHLGIWLSW